jgi:hypothetical protein
MGMSEQLKQLQDLEVQLRQVNEEFAKAARPLERLSELNQKQRQDVAAELRAWLARWERVTHEIEQVIGMESAIDHTSSKTGTF